VFCPLRLFFVVEHVMRFVQEQVFCRHKTGLSVTAASRFKLSLIKLFYNIVIEKIPKTISDLVTWRRGPYNLRGNLKAVVPRFSTSFLKNSIRYRGAVLWNFVSSYFNNATNHKQFCKKARMDPIFKKLNFGSLSIQTTLKHV